MRSNINTTLMDCKDFKNFLNVLTSSLGVEGNYLRFQNNNVNNYVETYEILPANWLESSAQTFYWNHHQIFYCNSKVFDCAAKLDSDGNPSDDSHDWMLYVNGLDYADYLENLSPIFDELEGYYNINETEIGVCVITEN